MNKKGSIIAEAAMVFPVIILSLIAVIYILIYFYDQTGEQVKMHMVLRSESGRMCDNMYYDNQDADGMTVYRKNNKIYSYKMVSLGKNGLLEAREKSLYAEKYLIDEAAIVRMADIMGSEGLIYE